MSARDARDSWARQANWFQDWKNYSDKKAKQAHIAKEEQIKKSLYNETVDTFNFIDWIQDNWQLVIIGVISIIVLIKE
ncbi:MAG: hypothetical protein AB9836_03475 [Aminipila sp.]